MLEDSPAASKFVETLINTKLRDTEIDPDVRARLHRNLLERLENQIIRSILNLLDEQEQLELEHLVDTNQVSEIEPYLRRHNVDMNQVLAGVMTEFQVAYLGA